MRSITLTLTVALGAAFFVGSPAAVAASSKSCTVGHTTAPFLSSARGRAAHVTGSVVVVTGRGTTSIRTPGVVAGRSAQPSVSLGQALVAFCVQPGHVAPGSPLLAINPAGVSVVATTARSLALTQTVDAHARSQGRIALSGGAELVQVLLDRSHHQASLLLNGGRRATFSADIPAATTISIGSAGHPSGSGVVMVPAAPGPISSNSTPMSTPAAPASTTPSTTAPIPTVPGGVTPPGTSTTAAAATLPTATTTTTTPTPPGLPPPIAPAGGTAEVSGTDVTSGTGTVTSTTTTPGVTAAQASYVPANPFSLTSFWNAPLAGVAAVDPNSPAYVNDLVSQVTTYGAWMNTTTYGVATYVVPAGQPTVSVQVTTYAPDLQQQFNAVPIPPGAKPAAGTDQELTVWQPSTDKLWEFWKLAQSASGTWSARWGGEMDNVSTNPGYFTHTGLTTNWGATATGLPLLGGLITTADLQRGYIDHALALAIPQATQAVFSWPAQRTDGRYVGGVSIPEGTRFRLDPTVNIASLNLPLFDRMLAQAAQTYGIVIRDQAGAVSFVAQDPSTTGSNPYPAAVGGSTGTIMNKFPWSHLQAMQPQLSGTS